MKIREIKYLLKEGVKNTWVNGIMSVASILTVLSCLIILGIFLLFSMNLNHLATNILGQYEIIAFVEEQMPAEEIEGVLQSVADIPNVKSVDLMTKEAAMEKLKQDLGDRAAFLEGFEGENNPLRNQLHISLVSLADVSATIQQVEGIFGIARVENNQELTDQILRVTDVIKMISFWILFLLVVMAVVIISNTVKVAMFARRKEINIMKFIGATDSFIRLPFIIEGVVIGLIGCVFAFVLVFYAYQYFYNSFSVNYAYLFTFVPVADAGRMMAIYFVALSILMGVVGSVISIRKHLKV